MAAWVRQRSDSAVDTASGTDLVYNVPGGVTYPIGHILAIALATEVDSALAASSPVTDTQGNSYDTTCFSHGSVGAAGLGMIYVKLTVPLVGNNGDKITFKFAVASSGRGCIVDQIAPPVGQDSGGVEACGGSANASAQSISMSLTSLTAGDLGAMAVFNRASGTQPTTVGTSGFIGGMTCETILPINAGWLSLSYGLNADTTGTETMEQNIGASGAARWRGILVKQVAGVGGIPANTVAPVVTGTPTQGHVLSSDTGTWTNSPSGYTYQWQRDVAGNGIYSNIGAATSATYTLALADVGCNVRCVVTATNGSGSAAANSNALGLIGPRYALALPDGGCQVCANELDGFIYSAGVVFPVPTGAATASGVAPTLKTNIRHINLTAGAATASGGDNQAEIVTPAPSSGGDGLLPYLRVAGVEVANAARTVSYMRNGLLRASQGHWELNAGDVCSVLYRPDGVRMVFEAPWLDPAPWYDPAEPGSRTFLGLVLLDFKGFDSTVSRSFVNRLRGLEGASFSRQRRGPREWKFRGAMISADDAGAEYGLRWLASVLRSAECLDCVEEFSSDVFVTNYLANPNFQFDLSGWTSGGATFERDSVLGVGAAKLTSVGFGDFIASAPTALTPPAGTLVEANAYVMGSPSAIGKQAYIEVTEIGGAHLQVSTLSLPIRLDGSWQRVSVTHEMAYGDRTGTFVTVGGNLGVGDSLHVNAIEEIVPQAVTEETCSPSLRVRLACPPGDGSDDDLGAWDSYDVALTAGPNELTPWAPKSQAQDTDFLAGCRDYVVVEFSMVAGNPYLYKPATVIGKARMGVVGSPDPNDICQFLFGQTLDFECFPITPPKRGTLGTIVTLYSPTGFNGVGLELYETCPGSNVGNPLRRISLNQVPAGSAVVVDSARRTITQTAPNFEGELITSDATELVSPEPGSPIQWLEARDCDEIGCLCVRSSAPCVTGIVDVTVRTQLRDG